MGGYLLLGRPPWLQGGEWEGSTMGNRRKSGRLWQWSWQDITPEPAEWQSYGVMWRDSLGGHGPAEGQKYVASK